MSQFPRPGLMRFLCDCEELFGKENICIFTTIDETRFRNIAERLVKDEFAPAWFATIRYIDWVGEHKDLRFVDDDINNVIIVDDYPPYIKQTQKHRLIQIKQYTLHYMHELPDSQDRELEAIIDKLKLSIL
jgi:hypothetical protein